jgi:hypothetical protein
MAASSSTSCAEGTNGGGSVGPSPFRFRKLVQRIREEFDYFPGLRLSAVEAAGFWALDLAVCQRVLKELLISGFLVRASDDRYAAAGLLDRRPRSI